MTSGHFNPFQYENIYKKVYATFLDELETKEITNYFPKALHCEYLNLRFYVYMLCVRLRVRKRENDDILKQLS